MAASRNTGQMSIRISVFNLDPIEQSKLWLQQGPGAANRILIGVLRAALLFGGTVVVDRNQLLEGIFFLSMPPERLAWHLGLEPGAKLPIEVQLLKADDSEHSDPGPWILSDGTRRWGLQDEGLVPQIEANYAAVKDDKKRVSSPLIALTGGQYEIADDMTRHESYSSVATPRTPAWNQSDHLVMPQGVWEQEDVAVAKRVREEGRLAWVHAMKEGRVAVRSGHNLGSNMIGRELSVEPPPNPEGLAVIDDLVTALIELEMAHQPETAQAKHCGADHWDDGADCRRAHVSVRSLVARWLDGERVDELDPPTLPEHLRGPEYADHRSAALGWWTLAYYRSIAERDGTRLLTIFNALPIPAIAADGVSDADRKRQSRKVRTQAIEMAWGLRKPERSAWEQFFARIRPLKKSKFASTLPIGGDVVDRLAAFTPSQYARLTTFEAVESRQLLKNPGRRSLFDLVMAIDEVVGDTTSRARRMRATALRAAVFILVASALVLYENGYIEISGVWGPIIAVTAAALLSAPWADLGALRRMSGSQLQSTLRFHHDPA